MWFDTLSEAIKYQQQLEEESFFQLENQKVSIKEYSIM